MGESPFRLLIVDDEEQLLDILVAELSELELPRGFEISTAKNGADALALIGRQPFEAVLSDIMMPVMSGLEFLHHARAAGHELPVIFLTGAIDKDKAIEALRLGAFDILEKPWDREQLGSSVVQALTLGAQIGFWNAEINSNLAKLEAVETETLKQLKQSYLAMRLLKYRPPAKKKSVR